MPETREAIQQVVREFLEYSEEDRIELFQALKRAEQGEALKRLQARLDPREVVVTELEPGLHRVECVPAVSPSSSKKIFRVKRDVSRKHLELILPRKRKHAAESEGRLKERFERDVREIEWLLAQLPEQPPEEAPEEAPEAR